MMSPFVGKLRDAGIRVSLFIDPDQRQIELAQRLRAPVVELHTGTYAAASGSAQMVELERLSRAAHLASEAGIECHAGHGLTFQNVSAVAAIPHVAELNIGHFLVGEAIFTGLANAIRKMKVVIAEGVQASRR
mgnify:CR=1 FL=1